MAKHKIKGRISLMLFLLVLISTMNGYSLNADEQRFQKSESVVSSYYPSFEAFPEHKDGLKAGLYGENQSIHIIILNLEAITSINEDKYDIKGIISIVIPILFFLFILLTILFILIRTLKAYKNAEKELKKTHKRLEENHIALVQKEDELNKRYMELADLQSKLEISNSRYKLAFKASGNGIWDENFMTNEVYVKENWYKDYINMDNQNNPITNWNNFIVDEDKSYYNKVRNNAFHSKMNVYECEYRIFSPIKNREIWIYENGFILRDSADKILRVVGGHGDITARKQQEERINELVHIDTLTKLYNKNSLYNKINTLCIEQSHKEHCIMLIDIDNFKHVNDTFGHDIGDQLLSVLGKRLHGLIEPNIMIGRYSGDEFIIVIEDINSISDVDSFVLKLKRLFAKEFVINLNKFKLTSSQGLALYPKDGIIVDELLKAVDLAMYYSKEAGKDRHTFYNQNMFVEFEEKLMFNRELYHGLIKGELYLVFQPIIKSNDKSIFGFEALLRWKSKRYGQVSPVKIIEAAEANGMIHEIGLWVFKEAISMLKSLNSYYNNQYKMSINLSTLQFSRIDFLHRFQELINQAEVNPNNIIVEITESAIIQNVSTCLDIVKEFKNMGMRIALDDFGTGYSSLSYFKQLPMDYIKVDKSFVDEMEQHNYDRMIIEVMEKIAHNRNMKIVAEGVESMIQYDQLVNVNYDLIQGYVFSKPLNEEELLKYLDEEKG